LYPYYTLYITENVWKPSRGLHPTKNVFKLFWWKTGKIRSMT
jgi:hypothetical protein